MELYEDIYNGMDMTETIRKMFNDCDERYHATYEGCKEIVDMWEANKKIPFDERFKDIPGFIKDQHCIVLDKEIFRSLDVNAILDFFKYIEDESLLECRIYNTIDGKNKYYWRKEKENLSDKLDMINRLPADVINYHGAIRVAENYKIARNNYFELLNKNDFTDESVKEYKRRIELFEVLRSYHQQYIDDEITEKINAIYPEMKAHSGKKTSKVVRKFFDITGVSKLSNFERLYAQYADAINPIKLDEVLILSWNLPDYLTMSNGDSWTSCHNIGFGGEGYGCYSSGTLSYALDTSSLVLYSITKKNSESSAPYWSHSKIRRQMFHISNDGMVVVQARLYPDDQTDWDRSTDFQSYGQYREVVQDIIAKAYGLNNLWTNKRGTDACSSIIRSSGTHYTDYSHYGNCNVSYNKADTILDSNRRRITVGHDPICPCCGEEHGDSCCTDEDCWEYTRHTCACCGEVHTEDEMNRIDGSWYCYNCSGYCNYHNEHEVCDFTYINNYGDVCEDAIDSMLNEGILVECENCGGYVLKRIAYKCENDEGETHYFDCSYCRDHFIEDHPDYYTV